MKTFPFAKRSEMLAVMALFAVLAFAVLAIVLRADSAQARGFFWLGAILAPMAAFGMLGRVASHVAVSESGFEYSSFGLRILKPWQSVVALVFDSFGIVRLVFRESVFENPIVRAALGPFVRDVEIYLTPYIDPRKSDELVSEIRRFAPQCQLIREDAEQS